MLREDSGYGIGEIKTTDSARIKAEPVTVTGIAAGSGTVRLVTNGATVTQTKAITAAELGLEGVGGTWTLSLATNDVDRLAADTGVVTLRDTDDVTIGSVLAVVPQKALSGIRATGAVSVTAATSVAVKQAIAGGSTVDLTGTTTVGIEAAIKTVGVVTLDAGTVLTLSAAGDISSDKASGTAVTLRGASGISTAGDVTTLGGDVVFENAVTLTGDIAASTGDGKNTGAVRFKSTVDGTTSGSESLTVTGNLVTLASVGVTTALESLSVSGTSSLAGGTTLRTVGNQTYTGAATSAGAVTVRAGAGSSVKFLGDATLGGLVTTGESYDVSLTGSTVTITDAVTFLNTGAVTLGDEAGDSLTFNGGLTSTASSVTNLAGTIATSDDLATFGKTFLNAATKVSTGTAGTTFSGTVDGGQSLAVNTTGTTTFNGAVGGTTALTSLSTNKGGTTAINGGSVKTSGADGQVYNDVVTLGANTTLDAAAGAITFATTLDGAYTLDANTTGATTFNGAVGGTTPLTSLTTNKGGTTAINGGSVKTSGSDGQVYNDAVTLGANTTLDAAAGAITFATTLDGSFALAANTTGTTTFGGAVGGTTALTSLAADKGGTTAINGGAVTTSGSDGQVYNDAVTLGANTTLDAAAGAITFATTLDGAFTLAANTTGTSTFGGAVGSTTPLAHLETNAGGTTAINGGAITTGSPTSQVYNDAVTLGANTVLDALSGSITFASTLDGAFTLAVNTTGTTTFGGAVGGTTALVSLTTNAGGTTAINGGTVKTSGVQQYNDAATLGANTSFTGSGVAFGSTVQGSSKTLSIDAGATGVSFGGNVGTSPEPLGAIDVGSVGVVTISGDIYSTGPVVIGSSGSGITMADGAVVDAGAGTILLSAAGDIALGGLTTKNATSDAVKVTSTGGAITDGGDTDTDIVATSAGAVVTLKAATGIGMSNALEIDASSVEATTTGGGIGLAAVSNLSIGVGGLSAPGVISLSAEGSILVPTGGRIVSGSVVASDPIQWSVLNTADSGEGSLRQVIANANATGVEGVAVFTTKTATFTPATPLPTIATKFTIDGTGKSIALDGSSKVATGLLLAAGSAGSTIRGLTVRNFTNAGIVLDSSAGTTVSGCVIQANGNGLSATGNLVGATVVGNTFTRNRLYGIQLTAARGLWIDGNTVTGVNTAASMGLYASGDLSGTRITGNTFTAGLRGALLDGARNLAFGEAGRGNSLLNNRAAPGTSFAGTGIRAQGNLAGTTIRGNTFAGNNYGMAFINAQNLLFGGRKVGEANVINTSSIAAVFVEGNNVGSAQVGTVLGAGSRANAKPIQRVKGSRGM